MWENVNKFHEKMSRENLTRNLAQVINFSRCKMELTGLGYGPVVGFGGDNDETLGFIEEMFIVRVAVDCHGVDVQTDLTGIMHKLCRIQCHSATPPTFQINS
jgi:hypothetical protein